MPVEPELVAFICPVHGWVLDTVSRARVECGRCQQEIAPEGVDLEDHKRRYQDTRRQRKYRDKRLTKVQVREP